MAKKFKPVSWDGDREDDELYFTTLEEYAGLSIQELQSRLDDLLALPGIPDDDSEIAAINELMKENVDRSNEDPTEYDVTYREPSMELVNEYIRAGWM